MTIEPMSLHGRYIVPALAQGLAVLSLFSRTRVRVSAPEIVQELKLSRTTVFRILHTLLAAGYLCRDDDDRHYKLGPAILGSGFSYLASLDFVEVAQPLLQKLRDATGMSAHMAIRDGRDIVYVARYAAQTTIRSSVTIGTRFPVHATVMGRMMLLDMDKHELAQLFPEGSLPRFTEQTPCNLPELQALLDGDNRRGYAASQSFFERGVNSVAAPVRDVSGAIVAAINVTTVDDPGGLEELHGSIKDKVLATASELTRWISRGAVYEQSARAMLELNSGA